jgi:hypothetical protein
MIQKGDIFENVGEKRPRATVLLVNQTWKVTHLFL